MSTNEKIMAERIESLSIAAGARTVAAAIVDRLDLDDAELVVTRTKPNIREIAQATTLKSGAELTLDSSDPWRPVVAGDKVAYWNGVEVQYHVVTKGEMVKVERYRSRSDKQRQHISAKIARDDAAALRAEKRAEREAARVRHDELERRAQQHSEAVARIAAASGL